jgi:predicted small integral membrane protein
MGDNIIIDLRETGWERVDWVHLAQNKDQWWALVNMVTNILVP